jgi:hypothetical protein
LINNVYFLPNRHAVQGVGSSNLLAPTISISTLRGGAWMADKHRLFESYWRFAPSPPSSSLENDAHPGQQ